MTTANHNIPAMTQSMSSLNRYRESLQQLQSTWDNLSLLSQLSGTGTDMSETRQAFGKVTTDVLDSLARETLNKTITAITAKAQVAVDIVVRNLFERTADIGFLSTDDNLSNFLDKHLAGSADEDDYMLLRERFSEYVQKYSVYFNVILLDAGGNILVQLDEDNPARQSHDPLIKEALHSDEPYIEVFRHSDLSPGQDASLIYARRVCHDDSDDSDDSDDALGVLCLCFKFENEMDGIFKDLIRKNEWCVGLLLDEQDRVVASSDHYQIPLGAPLEHAQGQDWILTRFAGRLYLAVTRETKGYQGYMGPGWRGHVMIPLEHAFEDNVANIIAGIDGKLLKKVMRSPLLFSATLLGIPKQAATIQSKLNQSVWNGNIWQKRDASHNAQQNNFSKMLLWEISNTGFKTQNVVEKTVADLYQTVVAVMLENSRFFASLAVDIMDRNLYERANDCRWWALTATFQRLLSQPELSMQEKNAITKVLVYINKAYTVYSNLVVFDRHGCIVAASNPAYQRLVGETITADWVKAALQLRHSQDYVVSDFEPSPLYGNQPTYIYAAAIRHQEQTVGGIGIVFDSTPQFSTMLADALPRGADNDVVKGSFTLYVDEKLRVISSTSRDFAVGSHFAVHPELCKLAPGSTGFDIALYNGNYYAVGARASAGYREYKDAGDSYKNHVTALIFIPLGKAADINAMIDSENLLQQNQFKPASNQAAAADAEEYATFYIGKHWLGLPASHIVEAVQANNIKPLPDTSSVLEGMLKHEDNVVPVLNLARLTGIDFQPPEQDKQIVIVQAGPKLPKFGLLVSALGEIPAIAPHAIEPLSAFFATINIPAEGIAKVMTEKGENLLILLSAVNLITRISEAAQQVNSHAAASNAEAGDMLEQAA
ncbi:chemotaxis protein CheW [Methylobacillus flagellatus]|uniref:chemotaxis protein CheW n=1 Tax=Methylobacillus flagellatus TaxID=405 RepID=UPI002853FE70|nr:chemotaxis protein CheW [Methylobacillus flagellatus]MDR5171736.1 chemotaxis protein CheW [Methylobacillus flagellatus]